MKENYEISTARQKLMRLEMIVDITENLTRQASEFTDRSNNYFEKAKENPEETYSYELHSANEYSTKALIAEQLAKDIEGLGIK